MLTPYPGAGLPSRNVASGRRPRSRGRGAELIPAALVLVLAAGIAATGCGGEDAPEESSGGSGSALEREIRDFHLDETHEGRLVWTLHASYAWRLPQQTQVRLDDVELLFYNREKTVTSRMTAEKGNVDDATGDMTAEGRVTVVSAEGDTLFTPSLRYTKSDDLITGTDFVRIAKPDRVLTGFGFRARPDLSDYEVERDVRVTFIDRERVVTP